MKTLDAKKPIYWSVCKISEMPAELLENTNVDLQGTLDGQPCYWIKTNFIPSAPCVVLEDKNKIHDYFIFDTQEP